MCGFNIILLIFARKRKGASGKILGFCFQEKGMGFPHVFFTFCFSPFFVESENEILVFNLGQLYYLMGACDLV